LYGVGNSALAVNKKMVISVVAVIVVAVVFVTLFAEYSAPNSGNKEMAHEKKWGIYVLDLDNEEIELIHSSADTITRIRLNNSGNELIFSQQIDKGNECVVEGSPINLCEEIFSIHVDCSGFRRLK
jgi:archaellum component FlaF (FlaF/FlaG flagellin family)